MNLEPPPTGLDHVFRAEVLVGDVEDHGFTRAGHRRVIPILGGRLSHGIDAEVLPGGADWQVVHEDGVLEIDTRYSARTTGGGLVHLRTRGIRAGAPEVLEALLHGAPVAPSDYYFRIVVELETSVPELRPLQDSLLVAAAARGAGRVVYDAYRVR
ncbi:hypothetical protein BCL57_001653 [Agromyces flavus]|uniref:Uncharacterized protein n=1 Tax=Agromyces flavus TaxID=589382 RepID=A0A1H1LCU7_9MICO|nr:DUF3237 domain-containing protein [Agromyces flavus]MCP2367499.1 hypothetical protein [Agromyces flavus]GGI45609.1 UPF0311 protein [Agromyces flavus]SDR71689.1 Protein of unknown function [Agromyces flavus]